MAFLGRGGARWNPVATTALATCIGTRTGGVQYCAPLGDGPVSKPWPDRAAAAREEKCEAPEIFLADILGLGSRFGI